MTIPQLPLFTQVAGGGVDNDNILVAFANQISEQAYAGATANGTVFGTFNVMSAPYNATGNGMVLSHVTTTSGSAVISDGVYSFAVGDVGKLITVPGAGASAAVLNGTISSVSAGAATLSVSAGTSIAGTGAATFGTNDTTAIQAAVTAAGVSGGVVVLPPGIYVINASITWLTNVSMIGAGASKSILKWISTGAMTTAVIAGTGGSASNPYVNCQFSDFEIDAIAATGAYATQQKGLSFQYMLRPIIERLYVHDTPATGIGTDFMAQAVVRDNVVSNCGRLATIGTSTGGAGIGIGTNGFGSTVESYVVSGNSVLNGKTFGILMENQNAGGTAYARVVDNYITMSATSGNGIGDIGQNKMVVANNTIIGTSGSLDGIFTGSDPLGGTTPGIDNLYANNTVYTARNGINLSFSTAPTASSVVRYRVVGNTLESSIASGILITPNASTAMDGIFIQNNAIYKSGGAGISIAAGTAGLKNLVLTDNQLESNYQTSATTTQSAGISINAVVAGLDMIGNKIYDSLASPKQLYGLIVNGVAVTAANITANDLSGNGTGAVSLVSSGTIAGQMVNNKGYNPVGTTTPTPGASPWTFTNGNAPATIYPTGGTVTGVTKNSISIGATPVGGAIPCAPNDTVVFTYTGTLTVTVDTN